MNTADDGGTNCDTGQPCSLRDALFSAGSGDTIDFAIGTGHKTITIASVLESSVSVTVDGTTQPGWAIGKPVIEINCGGSSIDALHLLGTLSRVKGLIVNGGCSVGVTVGTGSTIEGNFIGTDVTGTLPGSLSTGISVGGNTQIGGTTAATRNLIAGTFYALDVSGDGNRVQGITSGPTRPGPAASIW